MPSSGEDGGRGLRFRPRGAGGKGCCGCGDQFTSVHHHGLSPVPDGWVDNDRETEGRIGPIRYGEGNVESPRPGEGGVGVP